MRTTLLHAALVAAAVLVATVIDYATHSLDARFSVPEYYFRNKIIFGILWSWAAYYLFRAPRWDTRRPLVVAAMVAILLQMRYFIEGYALWFVFLFLGLHFLMFWAAFALFQRASKRLSV